MRGHGQNSGCEVCLFFNFFLFNWLYTNMLLKDKFWFCAGLGDAPVACQQNGRRLILFGRYHSPEKRESQAVKGHKLRWKHTLSSIGDLHIKLHVLYLKYSEMAEMTKFIVHCGLFFFFFYSFPFLKECDGVKWSSGVRRMMQKKRKSL